MIKKQKTQNIMKIVKEDSNEELKDESITDTPEENEIGII